VQSRFSVPAVRPRELRLSILSDSAHHEPVMATPAPVASCLGSAKWGSVISSQWCCVKSSPRNVVAFPRSSERCVRVGVEFGVSWRPLVLRNSFSAASHQSPRNVLFPALEGLRRTASANRCVRIARRLASLHGK
jgi:hypothetical protein